MFCYIWEFIVLPERAGEFEAVYGQHGEWVTLFRQDPAYIRTELLRDRDDPLRFITIDFWQNRERYLAFREGQRSAFNAMDTKYQEFTASEVRLGEFELIDP